ncbi:hypothetical protein ANCDUO_18085 [Ancylostoma duodenale]|uniref:SCP domain-containing protein n=1 Tax=Ancylostoma duodenale TaxID=51022 RepID=A0A0C2CPW1_9BILA|nr:hypothetical protein ANCDUO_18085 [Ancylostoma duodenale]
MKLQIQDERTSHAVQTQHLQKCDGQAYYSNAQRGALIEGHNNLRKAIAEGKHGKLPSAKNMYQLQYSCRMEQLVQDEIKGCSGRASIAEKYGQNFFV